MRPMFRYLVTASMLLPVAALGCGEQDAETGLDPVERSAVPDGPFKPAGIEDTIAVLASELDRGAAAELRLGVALGSGDEAWGSVKGGVERAFAELGAQGVLEAPGAAEQVEFLKRERADASDGIGVVPLSSALSTEIERAREGGAAVVTIESDLSSKRELFIGFGQYALGQRFGDVVTRATDLRVGTVVILGADDEEISASGYLRSMGAKSVLEESGFDVLIRNSSDADDGEARDVAMLTEDLLENPRPLAVVGVLESSYRVALAARAAERVLAGDADDEHEPTGLVRLKNVPFVSYGLEPATQDALRSGVLRSTLVERRHYMGYVVPYALAGISLLGVERTKYLLTPHLLEDGTVDVGVDVIGGAELDAYLEFQEQLVR